MNDEQKYPVTEMLSRLRENEVIHARYLAKESREEARRSRRQAYISLGLAVFALIVNVAVLALRWFT